MIVTTCTHTSLFTFTAEVASSPSLSLTRPSLEGLFMPPPDGSNKSHVNLLLNKLSKTAANVWHLETDGANDACEV